MPKSALRSVVATWRDRKGVAAMEYAVLATFVAAALATSVGSLGADLSGAFSNVATALTAPSGQSGSGAGTGSYSSNGNGNDQGNGNGNNQGDNSGGGDDGGGEGS
ncbi:MAG: Flp family type IVb pilin [Rhodospirillales bacterium]|nr:Flp family type IVb pilin [Rhodospirillales bacterium]